MASGGSGARRVQDDDEAFDSLQDLPDGGRPVDGRTQPVFLFVGVVLLIGCISCWVTAVQIANLPVGTKTYGPLVIGQVDTGCPAYVKVCYEVPYAAIFTGMGGGLFALFMMCCFAFYVMKQPVGNEEMQGIAQNIQEGAWGFLMTQYMYLTIFLTIFGTLIFVAIGWKTAMCYALGGTFSALSGFFGMLMATRANVRTAYACWKGGLPRGLLVAFRGGAVMGQSVTGLGLFGVCLCYLITKDVRSLAGFGAGGSSIALFARVAGGIFTKAADVGADLVGKVEAGLDEDDPRNPATIADCVGDNVGDVAGMGADLFESYVGGIIASTILGSYYYLQAGAALPLYITTLGVVCGALGCVYIHTKETAELSDLLNSMRANIGIVSVAILVLNVIVTTKVMTQEASDLGKGYDVATRAATPPGLHWIDQTPIATSFGLIMSVVMGLSAGFAISTVTEYFTAHTYHPTRSIAKAARFGAGPVIIHGLGQGMKSTIVPLLIIVATILCSFELGGFYAVSLTALAMLSPLGVTMSCDAFGPIADNAGGIAEMTESMPKAIRDKTDKLDALGNTTAATGKGFANGSAVLTALSTTVAFTKDAQIPATAYEAIASLNGTVNLIDRYVICGILLGSLLPYIFSALTMLAVGRAAEDMIREVRRQFAEIPGLLEKKKGARADYAHCVNISTQASLIEMVVPGALAVFTPLIVGYLFGANGMLGFIVGAIASGYLLGVMMSNAGGAWDNAKKFVEAGGLGPSHKKGSEAHKAAVSGDTVGDPFKDTSGPSLNILIKIQTRFTLVFAAAFPPTVSHVSYKQKNWVGFLMLAILITILIVMQCIQMKIDAKKVDMFQEMENKAAMDAEASRKPAAESYGHGQGDDDDY